MVMDDQYRPKPEARPTAKECRPCAVPRSLGFKVAASLLAAAVVLTATGFLMKCLLAPPAPTSPAKDNDAELRKQGKLLFANWPKIDLALLLSAEQHGYLLPCGCSRPQFGGLERRYNFLQTLKERGWPVLALDGGDIPQRHGPQALPNVQGLLKYEYSMKALKAMDYTAVNFGEYEMALPLDRALAQYALNNDTPRVIADNVKDRDNLPGTGTWLVAQPRGSPLKVGVAAVVGPSVRGKVQDPNVRFSEVKDVLPGLLKEMNKHKPDLRVLLYQGLSKEAKACAAAIPDFHVILCLSEFEEPASTPQRVGETMVVAPGHKGRYVGVVGVSRTGKAERPFDFHYQLASMSEDYETPADKVKDHAILSLMEQYAQELKRDNYLKKYGQTSHPIQVAQAKATYVGSHTCEKCHANEYAVWHGSAHRHAYETLEKASRPSLRQYDAECVVCHVVGFGYQGGFTEAERTPLLKGVGCESCHGPASLHVSDSKNAQFREALNPWKALPGEVEAKRIGRIEQSCVKCHDTDNDVHWSFDKWKKIAH